MMDIDTVSLHVHHSPSLQEISIMPKETFYNLPETKKQQVLAAVKQEFEEHPIHEASVKDIVTALGIARGSFYTYFENLAESYFAVLDQETIEIHELFTELLRRHQGSLIGALEAFGRVIADELLKPGKAALYRNRYLYWTPDLDQQWQAYRADRRRSASPLQEAGMMSQEPYGEMMHVIKAVIHDLIRRMYLENWDQTTFLNHFQQQIEILSLGLNDLIKHKE